MPATGVSISYYESVLQELQQETDATLDSFIATAELGRGFSALMEKMEEQIAIAEKLQNSQSDLELNEAVVLADKLDSEFFALERFASGAMLSETQEEWAEEFEHLKNSLEKMEGHFHGIKSECATKGAQAAVPSRQGKTGRAPAKPAGSHHLLFHRHARICKAKLSRLRGLLTSKAHPIHAKVKAAKQKISSLRTGVRGMLSKIAKIRLRKKIAEAKSGMLHFMEKTGKGRIFLDHRHLTLTGNGDKMRVSLTDSVCYGFEEIVPIDATPAKLAKSFLIGSFEKSGNGMHFKIGERKTIGDSIIYKERSFSC